LGLFFKSENKPTSLPKTLVIIVDDFNLSEKTERHSETGRFKLGIRFFGSDEKDNFVEILSIDTAYEFNKTDVTQKLLRVPSVSLGELAPTVFTAVYYPISTVKYNYKQLQNIDSIEKMQIPAYTNLSIKNEVYRTYEQFKINTPDTATYSIDTSKNGRIKVGVILYGKDLLDKETFRKKGSKKELVHT